MSIYTDVRRFFRASLIMSRPGKMNRSTRQKLHRTVCAEAQQAEALRKQSVRGSSTLRYVMSQISQTPFREDYRLQSGARRPYQHHQVLAIYICVFTSKVMWRRGRALQQYHGHDGHHGLQTFHDDKGRARKLRGRWTPGS